MWRQEKDGRDLLPFVNAVVEYAFALLGSTRAASRLSAITLYTTVRFPVSLPDADVLAHLSFASSACSASRRNVVARSCGRFSWTRHHSVSPAKLAKGSTATSITNSYKI